METLSLGAEDLFKTTIHDLNSPLQIVLAYAEQLREASTQAERDRCLQALTRGAAKLQHLVGDLTSVFLSPAKPRREVVDVVAAARECVEALFAPGEEQ